MQRGALDTLAALCGSASKSEESASTSGESSNGSAASGSASSATGIPALVQNNQASFTFPHGAPISALSQLGAFQVLPAPPAYGGVPNPAAAAAVTMLIQAAIQNPATGLSHAFDPNALKSMQQVAYYQYMMSLQANGQQLSGRNGSGNFAVTPPSATSIPHSSADQSQAVSASGASSHGQPQVGTDTTKVVQQTQHSSQVIPGPTSVSPQPPLSSSQNSCMKPPPPPSQGNAVPSTLSTNGILTSPQRPIAPSIMPPPQSSSAQLASADAGGPYGDKKQLKRDANRRSAQLSRKRKKQFIEELKEENDELRRKEQILKSIPDLIVVFDSAGKLWFVSHSVNRFVDFSPKELEGSSFWDRLCEESVRLLKAAFMDALAARKSDMDTTPLGSGVWELRLVDKDGSHKIVTLNGVVHFSGDTPECVCSIRPRDEKAALDKQPESFAEVQAPTLVSALPGRASITSAIKPHQSVIASTGGKEDSSVHFARGKAQAIRVAAAASGQPRRAAQISDGDSGSVVSESGSE